MILKTKVILYNIDNNMSITLFLQLHRDMCPRKTNTLVNNYERNWHIPYEDAMLEICSKNIAEVTRDKNIVEIKYLYHLNHKILFYCINKAIIKDNFDIVKWERDIDF